MLRIVAIALMAACLTGPAWAQAQPVQAQSAQPAAKSIAKKPATKSKPAKRVESSPPADSGPCSLGVIPVIGNQLSVEKFGVTVFETEENEVPIEGWGLDDLVMARVRAATGADPTVRRISYSNGVFEPYYNPTSRFLPDPRESLSSIVRSVTASTNCARYLVVTRSVDKIPNSNLTLKGIGTYNQGLGSLIRHSHLFANISINLIDGQSYEKISTFSADTGSRLSETMRLTEDPLKKLDNSDFPDPPSAASNSAVLRERIRTLVAAKLDRDLPNYLKEQ
jgi:hypothetical protein